MKLCRRCNTHKPVTQFYKSKANADGYDGRCKACDAVQCAQRRKRKERIEVGSRVQLASLLTRIRRGTACQSPVLTPTARAAAEPHGGVEGVPPLRHQQACRGLLPEQDQRGRAVQQLQVLLLPGRAAQEGAPASPRGAHSFRQGVPPLQGDQTRLRVLQEQAHVRRPVHPLQGETAARRTRRELCPSCTPAPNVLQTAPHQIPSGDAARTISCECCTAAALPLRDLTLSRSMVHLYCGPFHRSYTLLGSLPLLVLQHLQLVDQAVAASILLPAM